MPRVSFVACSLTSIVDRFTNLLTVVGVVESLPIPSFPFWIPSLSYSAVIRREQGDGNSVPGRITIRIGETTLTQSPVSAEFGEAQGAQVVLNFQGLGVPSAGDLEFVLEFNERVVSTYKIQLVAVSTIARSVSSPTPDPANPPEGIPMARAAS